MMLEHGQKLLERDWTKEDRELIRKLIDNLVSYKHFLTKTIKQDITSVLELAIHIKDNYEGLKDKLNIIESCVHEEMKTSDEKLNTILEIIKKDVTVYDDKVDQEIEEMSQAIEKEKEEEKEADNVNLNCTESNSKDNSTESNSKDNTISKDANSKENSISKDTNSKKKGLFSKLGF